MSEQAWTSQVKVSGFQSIFYFIIIINHFVHEVEIWELKDDAVFTFKIYAIV